MNKTLETLRDYSIPVSSSVLITLILVVIYRYNMSNTHNITEEVTKIKENFKDKNTQINKLIDIHEKSNNNDLSKINIIMKDFMKDFMKEIKRSSESLVYFNNERKINSNYLNIRNHLFTKDIETRKILIDTNSGGGVGVKPDTNNYTIVFGSNGKYPEEFKNIIGFRLVKCVIPVCLYHVKEGMNTFKINDTKITLVPGNYIFAELASMINHALKHFTTGYSIKINNKNDYTLKLKGPNKSYLLTFESNNLHRLFGFNLDEKNQIGPKNSRSIISSNPIDKSTHYVDLVIPEIPHIACKLNSVGQPVIDRIPLMTETGSLNYYETPFNEYFTQNYFYPIKLNKLTIQLYEDSENNFYTTNGRDNYFEFEVTILKNTKLMNE